MSSINFDNVWLLLIGVPLVVLFLIPFFIAVRKDNVNGHNIASAILHVIMALLIAFAAAGTYFVAIITATQVYVVADVSYSANKNLDTVDGYIKSLTLPRNSKLGVICFGKDYELVTELGKRFDTVKNSTVDDTETNICEALEYAGSLFDGDVIKRIVLITDGLESYPDDANKLKRAVDSLAAKNVRVDAVFLDDNLPSDAKEVQISNADFTKNAYLNRDEKVTLNIQTSYPTSASVTLYKNGQVIGGTKTVSLTLGSNNVSLKLDTFEAGTFDYRVTIDAEGDECQYNNSYSFTQKVSEIVDVLLIASDAKDLSYLEGLYGANTHIDQYIGTPDIPANIEDIAKYDEIVISDTDVTTLNNYELFLDSLNSAVSLFGKSLITFGDLGIQNVTDGSLNTLDDLLPIKYSNTVGDPKLYTIAIDISHSMRAGASRFMLAKLAAIQLINLIQDENYVQIVYFSGSSRGGFYGRVGPNREEIVSSIRNGLTTEQGTYIGLGLDTAWGMIKDRQGFSSKQVILITDGLPFRGTVNYGGSEYEGMTDKQVAEKIAANMLYNGVHTTVMQVGANNEAAELGGAPETDWLKSLAFMGGGKHYWAQNEAELGQIILDDFVSDQKPDITNTWVTADRSREEVLNNIKQSDLRWAYVSDYVLGKTKSAATQVLSVEYTDGRNSAKVPLYAYWSHGNGKAASYSGKLGEIKLRAAEGVSTTAPVLNRNFFGNVLSLTMPEEKTDYPYTLTADVNEKTVNVKITPAELRAKASAKITVTDPDGQTYTDDFVFDSTSYNYKISAAQVGKYTVDVVYSYNNTDYAANMIFNVSYEPEYDAFNVYEASTLYKMVGSNGDVSEDGEHWVRNDGTISGDLALVNDDSKVATYTVRLTVPFLILVVVLYVVDIAVRKLKWADIVNLFQKIGSKEKGGKK